MGYITIAFLAMTALPLILGLLIGLSRGSGRSFARLIVICACLVLAFVARQPLTESLLQIEVEGKTIAEMVMASLPAEYASMQDTIMLFVKLISSAIVFVAVFFVAKFLTSIIITPIVNVFVGNKRKKNHLMGGVFGLAQGVIVAVALCIPLNGVLANVNNVAKLANEMNQTVYVYSIDSVVTSSDPTEGSQPGTTMPGGTDVSMDDLLKEMDDYFNSDIGKFYSALGKETFVYVSDWTENGQRYTLDGQFSALSGALKMAQSLQKLSNMGDDLMGADNLDAVSDLFNSLDEAWTEMPDEAKQTVIKTIESLAKDADLPVDVSVIDFETLDFKKEGEVFAELQESMKELEGKEEITAEEAKEMLSTLAKSDIILPLVSSADTTDINLSDSEKAIAKDYIDGLTDVSDEKKDMLKSIVGIVE